MSVTGRHRQFRHETEKVPMARTTHRTNLGPDIDFLLRAAP